GLHELVLGNGTQQDDPADRNHHRTSQALEGSPCHELRHGPGKRADDGRQREQQHRCGKDASRAEAVCGPPAQGNEHRHGQQVRSDGDIHAHGRLAKGEAHRRQRCCHHGGIEHLHEQGASYDAWNDVMVAAHGCSHSTLSTMTGYARLLQVTKCLIKTLEQAMLSPYHFNPPCRRDLTPREREVLDYVLAGNPHKLTAYSLGISQRTVEVHRSRILQKPGVRSAIELVTAIYTRSGPAAHLLT